ncbi:MAG: hypothetical protein IPI35_23315 [Deltaproteobacteria bacterium]|nr:hypothetical protein [Deltaproteobacteria bacterium]
MIAALPTLSDAAATLRRAIPRARLTTLARDLTEALGQLALAASQRPVNEDDLLALRSVFARLDGLPQALRRPGAHRRGPLAEIEGEREGGGSWRRLRSQGSPHGPPLRS